MIHSQHGQDYLWRKEQFDSTDVFPIAGYHNISCAKYIINTASRRRRSSEPKSSRKIMPRSHHSQRWTPSAHGAKVSHHLHWWVHDHQVHDAHTWLDCEESQFLDWLQAISLEDHSVCGWNILGGRTWIDYELCEVRQLWEVHPILEGSQIEASWKKDCVFLWSTQGAYINWMPSIVWGTGHKVH